MKNNTASAPAPLPRRSTAWRVAPLEDRDLYPRELEDALEKGDIPDAIREEMNWVGAGEQPQADRVIAYVQGILDRLSMATHDRPHPEMRIILSDMAGVNTGIIPSANPPILVVGLGLIDLLAAEGLGEDHLAAVLSHERFHLLKHDKWGDLKNGRPEETAADIFAVYETNRAGYAPSAATEVFAMLRKRGGSMDRVNHLGRIFDEHPATEDRIRNTQLALAHLQLTQRMDKGITPLPGDVLTASLDVKYRTHFEKYAAARDYTALPPQGKVRLIHAYIQNVLETQHIVEKYSRKSRIFPQHLCGIRMACTLGELTALAREDGAAFRKAVMPPLRSLMMWSDEDGQGAKKRPRFRDDRGYHVQWMTRTYARLYHYAGVAEEEKAQYSSLDLTNAQGIQVDLTEERNGGWSRHRTKEFHAILPPVFQSLEKYAADFWDAANKDGALIAARRFNAAAKVLERYESGLKVLDLLPPSPEWPARAVIRKALNSEGRIRLPWENIVRFIEDAAIGAQDREILLTTALTLGCPDPRLTGRDYEIGHYDGKYRFSELQFDAAGDITGLALSENEKMAVFRARYEKQDAAALFDNELQETARRIAAENTVLRRIDWSGMDGDFKGFIMRHADWLEPSYSIIPCRAPFAAAFLRELDKRAEKSPQWAARRDWFISGIDRSKSSKSKRSSYGYDDDERSEDALWSLPDLIRRTEEKYFGYASLFGVFDHRFKGKRGELPQRHAMADRLAALPDTREARSDYKYDDTTGIGKYVSRKPKKVKPKEQQVMLDYGIDPRHPYVKALLHAPDSVVPLGKRNNLLSHFRHRDYNARTLAAHTGISLRHVFNFRALNTAQGFDRLQYRVHSYSMSGRQFSAWNDTGAKDIELLRSLRRLDAGAPRRFDFEKLSAFTVASEFYHLRDKNLAHALRDELSTLVERQVQRNAAIDLAKTTPLATLLRRYTAMRGDQRSYRSETVYNAFFTRPKLEKRYTNDILKRIHRLPADERIAPLNQFLKLQIKDPAQRKDAVALWVDAQGAALGPDDATPAYKAAAMNIVKGAMRHMEGGQAMSCVIRLLDRIEAQEDVALTAKQEMVDHFGAQFLSSDIQMRAIESAIHTCARHPALRSAFLAYITEPLTPEGTRKFAQALKTYGYDRYDSQASFIKQFYNPEEHFTLPPAQERMVVDYLHKNFWDAPFELRTVYLDRILFPTHESAEDTGDEAGGGFTKAVNYVLGKVLPLDRKFAAEAREALGVYLDQCPHELRRTTFSAILATTQENGGAVAMRPGQVLSYVLARTGAAGGQLLQAGHSYLGGLDITDPDLARFRDDLKDSKVNFEPPHRWEIFERLKTALSDEERADIGRIGPVLGSGSTAYVVGCTRKDGGDNALKLMRPRVRDVADLHFERYGAAFDVLAARHAAYKPLPGMVRHAQAMIRTATDGHVAAEQVRYAQNLYDGLRVEVNGRPFDFSVAGHVRHGGEFLETARVSGMHLNDFAAGDPQKFGLAVAVETAELYRMLQGMAIDEDRHGGQQKITGRRIGIFDVGALPFDAEKAQIRLPSQDEKIALGAVLGHMANAAASGASPIEAMVAAVTGQDWGAAKDYLVGIKRGLLARTDAHGAFGASPQDRAAVHAAIFTAVLRTGQVDPDIAEGVTQTLSPLAALRLAGGHLQSVFSGQADPLRIAIHDSTAAGRIKGADLAKIARHYAAAALTAEGKTLLTGRDGPSALRRLAQTDQSASKWHAARSLLQARMRRP